MENTRTGKLVPNHQRRPCFFYARGNCNRGNECKFRHDPELKRPCDYVTRRFLPNTSRIIPIAPSPTAEDPEVEYPQSIQDPELSRSALTLLPTHSTSEFGHSTEEIHTRESSGSCPEMKQGLPIGRADGSTRGDSGSGQGTQDSHITESAGNRSLKRLLLVPITMCLLVPDLTGLTQQQSASKENGTSSPAENSPKLSTAPSHDRREFISGFADEIVIDDMERDELATTALSALKYVFGPVENRPVFQTPNSLVKFPQ